MSGPNLSSGPSVLIRADASPRIGGGHIMRCLSLADEFARRGASVAFACALIPEPLAARIDGAGHRLIRIDQVPELLSETPHWDSMVLPPRAQQLDAESALAGVGRADWIVLDHYRLDATWLDALGAARKLVVDDLANRLLPCDILVDQTFGRRGSDYSELVPALCRILVGARYATLRPEFAAARPDALVRRRSGEVKRLLISLGSTDIGGVTLAAVESVLVAGVACAIDVVLASGTQSLEPLRALASENPQITLHVNTADMLMLMVEADLAVGAPGTSSWERCCLGLPAVTVVIADNQRLVSKMLAEAGAVVAVDSPTELGGAVADLIEDHGARARMIAAAAAITEGKGVTLVADAMFDEPLEVSTAPPTLRAAKASDATPLWLWRNDPLMRAMAKSGRPIAWADHDRWLAGILLSTESCLFMADVGGVPVAMVRFDRQESGALVSISVDPAMRGRGVGRAALIAACERYEAASGPEPLMAEVRPSNPASIRIFETAGFERESEQAKEFLRFVRRRNIARGVQ